MRMSKVAALMLIVGATSIASVSLARAASDCPISVTLAEWGENSKGYLTVVPGGSCQFPIKLPGTMSSSDISQKPGHGKLKKSTHLLTNIRRRLDTRAAMLLPSQQRVKGPRLLARP
jgi:hypothetical protein